jgi:hypothetical protein
VTAVKIFIFFDKYITDQDQDPYSNHQDITGLFIGLLSGLDPSLSGFAFIFFLDESTRTGSISFSVGYL